MYYRKYIIGFYADHEGIYDISSSFVWGISGREGNEYKFSDAKPLQQLLLMEYEALLNMTEERVSGLVDEIVERASKYLQLLTEHIRFYSIIIPKDEYLSRSGLHQVETNMDPAVSAPADLYTYIEYSDFCSKTCFKTPEELLEHAEVSVKTKYYIAWKLADGWHYAIFCYPVKVVPVVEIDLKKAFTVHRLDSRLLKKYIVFKLLHLKNIEPKYFPERHYAVIG